MVPASLRLKLHKLLLNKVNFYSIISGSKINSVITKLFKIVFYSLIRSLYRIESVKSCLKVNTIRWKQLILAQFPEYLAHFNSNYILLKLYKEQINPFEGALE